MKVEIVRAHIELRWFHIDLLHKFYLRLAVSRPLETFITAFFSSSPLNKTYALGIIAAPILKPGLEHSLTRLLSPRTLGWLKNDNFWETNGNIDG